MILRRLSSEAWHSFWMHADNFINDFAYGSIGFIILFMSRECFFFVYMLRSLLRATW